MTRLVGMDARPLVGANTIRPGNIGKAIVMLREFGVGIGMCHNFIYRATFFMDAT
jgi:hypothetical protein